MDKLSDADFDRILREGDLDRDGSISFEEFAKLLLPANKRSLVCGVQVGDKVPGETRKMRYAGLKDLEGPLVSEY